MTTLSHTIWFPSLGGNMGIISKIFKETLSEELHGLEYKLIDAKYKSDELFTFDLDVQSEDQTTYIKNKILSRFGQEYAPYKSEPGLIVQTRMLNPDQVGFGVFCRTNAATDVLLPLYELRSLVGSSKVSSRKIVEAFGFVENFPLELVVDTLEKGKTKMIFSDTQHQLFQSWFEENVDRLIISMTYSSDVKAIVRKLSVTQYIDRIYDLDPLTTIIVCNKGTRGTGLLPIIGKLLHSVPIGIFSPSKIRKLRQTPS